MTKVVLVESKDPHKAVGVYARTEDRPGDCDVDPDHLCRIRASMGDERTPSGTECGRRY